MDKSQIRWLCISLGISFTVLFLFLLFTFDTNTLDELQNCNVWLILLALLMHIVSIGFWALRLKYMCRSLGYKVPFLHLFNLVCSNQFVASVTPSQIGGEPVRIYELTKAKVPAGEATAIVIMERVFDAVVLAIGTIVSVILLGLFFTTLDLPEDYIFIAYFAAGVFTALLVLFFIVAKNPRIGTFLATKVLDFIARKWPNKKSISMQTKFMEHLNCFYAVLEHFIGKSKSGLFIGLFFSALFWVNEFLLVSILMMGLGLPPNFLISFIFMIFITVIMMIPLTPGSAGIAEISMAGFYALIIPTSLVGVFVLLWRLIIYYFNLVTGFIATMIIVRREAKGKEVKI